MTDEEKEIERLNKGRLMQIASRELLPLLDTMKKDAISKIIMSHKGHAAEELPAHAAELSVIEDLRSKIERSNRETEKREEKLYATE